MKPIEEILYDLALPLVEDKKSLSVKHLPSLDENEIVLTIYANSSDVARLIGKQGVVAQSFRQVMAIGSRVLDQRISIKFESY